MFSLGGHSFIRGLHHCLLLALSFLQGCSARNSKAVGFCQRWRVLGLFLKIGAMSEASTSKVSCVMETSNDDNVEHSRLIYGSRALFFEGSHLKNEELM